MTQTAKRTSKRKRRNKKAKEYATYIFAIQNWDWDFFFGVNENTKWNSDPYYDFRHLKILALVVSPNRYKNQAAELIFLPHTKLNEENRQQDPTPHVGTLSVERAGLMGLLSLPQDWPNRDIGRQGRSYSQKAALNTTTAFCVGFSGQLLRAWCRFRTRGFAFGAPTHRGF